MSKRIFLAVNIPNEIRGEIFEKLGSKIPSGKCKIVRKENIHFTVLFLGHFADDAIEELREKLQEIEFGKFKIKISGVGHFKGRIIWLGTAHGAEELKKLNMLCREITGITDERFHAHATIARNKFLGREETDELLENLKIENFEAEFEAESLDLMESILKKEGAEYELISSVKFI